MERLPNMHHKSASQFSLEPQPRSDFKIEDLQNRNNPTFSAKTLPVHYLRILAASDNFQGGNREAWPRIALILLKSAQSVTRRP
jgi:hypothetical protein